MSKKSAAQTVKPKPEPSRDNTREKHQPWKPGESGNPKGRPKGARSRLGEDFIKALEDNFKENGVAAIQKVCDEKPAEYLKIIAGVLPKDINLNVNEYEHLSDEQLADRIRQLDAIIGPFPGSTGEGDINGGTQSKARH